MLLQKAVSPSNKMAQLGSAAKQLLNSIVTPASKPAATSSTNKQVSKQVLSKNSTQCRLQEKSTTTAASGGLA